MSDVSRIFSQIENGQQHRASDLLPLVYDELRKLATARLACEQPGQTLQATALVHEAYLRLVGPASGTSTGQWASGGRKPAEGQQWDNRGHFFAAAAEAMRRILIERARQKQSLKRGGGLERVELNGLGPAASLPDDENLLALDEALHKLAAQHPRKAELVKLRFFAGLTTAQAAEALAVSVATAENDWAYARSWLKLELTGDEAAGKNS